MSAEERGRSVDVLSCGREVVGVSCHNCGFVRDPLPPWVRPGAAFLLAGASYRIVAEGSTNEGTKLNKHFWDYAYAEPFGTGPWAMPEAPCSAATVASAVRALRGLPRFSAAELAHALPLAEFA